MKSHPGRGSLRLEHYDYSQSGAYFVTICTYKKEAIFGQVVEDDVELSEAGRIIQDCWESLSKCYPAIQTDAFIVMPNHIHGIIMIVEDNVGAIHRSCRDTGGTPVRDGMNCPYNGLEFNDEECCYLR